MDAIRIGDRHLTIVRGDITTVEADAIVNAANSELAGGGGVDGAIHRVGGPAIMADLERRYGALGVRRCETGRAVVTEAGRLPARWVIHAVGPVWQGGGQGEAAFLASAYRSAMDAASLLDARVVTLPAISCGVYGYPLAEAADIAVRTVAGVLEGENSVRRATFVLFGQDTLRAFDDALEGLATG